MKTGPPYPEITNAEQDKTTDYLAEPSLEGAEFFARKGKMTIAIRMYREITGNSLAETKRAVDKWNNPSD